LAAARPVNPLAAHLPAATAPAGLSNQLSLAYTRAKGANLRKQRPPRGRNAWQSGANSDTLIPSSRPRPRPGRNAWQSGANSNIASIQDYLRYFAQAGTFELAAGFTGTVTAGTIESSNNDYFVSDNFTPPNTVTSGFVNGLQAGVTFGSNYGGLSVTLNNTSFVFAKSIIGQDFQAHQVVVTQANEGGGNNLANFKNWGLISSGNPGPSPSTSANDGGVADNATFLFSPAAAPQYDLAIKKTDDKGGTFSTATNNTTGGTAAPGDMVTYTIVVTNNGPSTATGVAVSDLFPSSLVNVSWTAVANGGDSVTTAGGTGNISDTVTLLPDANSAANVTFTVTAGISVSATGSVINTAAVQRRFLQLDGHGNERCNRLQYKRQRLHQ
jgi:uncharacterized repeat protein (TIGR01451 family)